MLELQDDLFSITDRFDAICVTTNSVVGKDDKAIMSGGCALECAKRWPQSPYVLGRRLIESGRNIPFQLGLITPDGKLSTEAFVEEDMDAEAFINNERIYYCRLFSFPTKHHYRDPSDIDLIKESCIHMLQFANVLELEYVAIPRPGSGLGGLNYEEVREAIKPILDDRFYIVHLQGK